MSVCPMCEELYGGTLAFCEHGEAAALEEADDYGNDPCWRCGGAGFIVTCCDDICRGLGYCIHGDGETECPVCHGEEAVDG